MTDTFVSYNKLPEGTVLKVIGVALAAGGAKRGKRKWIHVFELMPANDQARSGSVIPAHAKENEGAQQ